MYEKYLEPVIETFTTGEYYREVFNAKEEYFQKAGKVFDDDPEFESRMCIFMDWYLFDRDLPGVDLPPIKFYYKKFRDNFSNEEVKIYEDLCNTVHSIFTLRRFTWFKRTLVVQDLFSGRSYEIADHAKIKFGFSKGDIFEARVFPFKKEYEFSKGFCFHPIEMRGFIMSEVKKVRHQSPARHTKLILQLAQMKLNHLRRMHIDVRQIYSFDSKLIG